jgi:hypothetical protein
LDCHLDEGWGVINFDIKIDQEELDREVRKLTANQVRPILDKVAKQTQSACRAAFRKEIMNRVEYAALFRTSPSNYSLGAQLGLENPNGMVNPIVEAAASGIEVSPLAVRGKGPKTVDFGGIQVIFRPQNLWYLTDLIGSSYTSTSKRGSYIIDWLGWLLFSGTNVVVLDYYVKFGTGSPNSRTGDAVMIHDPKKARNFRIHSVYAGTANDNWITRAAKKAAPKIQRIIEKAIEKAFQ